MEATDKEFDVVATRSIDAPTHVVFQAWTTPAQASQWWGPAGFTMPVCEMKAESGGALFMKMQDPEGNIYPMSGTFEELSRPSRLVFTSAPLDDEGKPLFSTITTVHLNEKSGTTELHLEARCTETTQEGKPYLEGMKEGWNQCLDRLKDWIEDRKERELVFQRVINQPPEKVFKAFTQPGQTPLWWGPAGFHNTVQEMNVKPGGIWRFTMHGPDGQDYDNRVVYHDIDPPRHLTYTSSNDVDNDPGAFYVEVTFDPAGTGNTKITLTMNFPTVEQKRELEGYGVVDCGNQTIDRLQAHLDSI